MPLMLRHLFVALREAGASDVVATAAAEEVADLRRPASSPDPVVRLLPWIGAVNAGLLLILIVAIGWGTPSPAELRIWRDQCLLNRAIAK
jgi:hypothetical protein